MDKKELSEIDICDLFITPAIKEAGWDQMTQIRREVTLTPGPVIVRGNMSARNKKKKKFADYVLSWEPGVPVAVIEAMVYGLAIVTTPVGSIPDILSHGENGIIIETDDIEGLANSLIMLLSKPKQRYRLGENAYHQGRDLFQPKIILDKLYALYQELNQN